MPPRELEIVGKLHSHHVRCCNVLAGLSQEPISFLGTNDNLKPCVVLTISMRCQYRDQTIYLQCAYRLWACDFSKFVKVRRGYVGGYDAGESVQ